MKTQLALVLVVAAVSLFGCTKRADTTVSGTDEDRLEAYASKLEELRSRIKAQDLGCKDTCNVARETCDIATQVCDIARRTPDAAQTYCVSANEDCARANDLCSSCQQ